jgi:hypothetical protein
MNPRNRIVPRPTNPYSPNRPCVLLCGVSDVMVGPVRLAGMTTGDRGDLETLQRRRATFRKR